MAGKQLVHAIVQTAAAPSLELSPKFGPRLGRVCTSFRSSDDALDLPFHVLEVRIQPIETGSRVVSEKAAHKGQVHVQALIPRGQDVDVIAATRFQFIVIDLTRRPGGCPPGGAASGTTDGLRGS